jgi:hypothetical protein
LSLLRPTSRSSPATRSASRGHSPKPALRSPRRGTRTKRIPARAAASRTRTTMIRRVQPRSTRHAEGDHLQRADASPSALAGALNVYFIEVAIREIRRVLRPGGTVLLCEETRLAESVTEQTRRPQRGCPVGHWHRPPQFYAERFAPLEMTYSSYIDQIRQAAPLDLSRACHAIRTCVVDDEAVSGHLRSAESTTWPQNS